MSIKEQAVDAGFKQVLGTEQTGYVFLSEMTDGRAGRRLYIKGNLAPKFSAMVAESRQNYVLSQLVQLRALAGGNTSYSNVSDATQHKTQLGDIAVTYSITQEITNGLQPGVFITDIEFGLFGKGNLPGLYRVTRDDDRWKVNVQNETDQIQSLNASINGLSNSLEQAAEDIMPPMVEYTYGHSGLNQKYLYKEGFTHFYYPQSIKVDGKQWKTPEQKQTNHKQCAAKLARALRQAQSRGKKVQWTIHGTGSNLLKSALQMLDGANLDKHEVMFMAPDELNGLLPMMQRAGMNLHKDVMKYSEAEVSTSKFKNTQWNAGQIASEIRQFGSRYRASADLLEAKALKTGSSAFFNFLITSYNLGWGTAAQTAVKMTNHGIRNAAASMGKVTDQRVNPHLNPQMCQAGFNDHAKRQSGGTAGAYKATFKELVKKVRSA